MPDAKHWRERAAEARVRAEAMQIQCCKQAMLDIVRSYEQMAACAERREGKDEAMARLREPYRESKSDE